MRSDFIKIDPGTLRMRVCGLSLEERGAYFTMLFHSYGGFTRYSSGRPEMLNVNNEHDMRWSLGCDRRKWRRVLDRLVARKLVKIAEDGTIYPKDYSATAWLRRPASPAEKRVVFKRDGAVCRRCGATENLAIDHIIPIAKGGPEWFDNYQVLCRPCNSSKGART